MIRRQVGAAASVIVALVGVALFGVASVHYLLEIQEVADTTGPIVAYLLNGALAIVVVYCGYWLRDAGLDPEHRWIVVAGCVGGAVLLAVADGGTIFIRRAEGRVVEEPLFELLVSTDTGAIAGFVAGYFNARARQDAARAHEARRSLSFVNDLLRHDLRNHLTSIEAQAELLDTRLRDDGDSDERIEAIHDRIYESADLIESAEAIVGTLAGEESLEPVDLAEYVAESTERIAETGDATVETDLPDSAPVLANEGLRSVVSNLVENAIEHNDSETPTVEVDLERDGDVVRLRVADDGPGIPDETKGTIFDPRENDPHGGGLSLVSTLVDRYGGDVWVEDNHPRGSVFVVELAAADAAITPDDPAGVEASGSTALDD